MQAIVLWQMLSIHDKYREILETEPDIAELNNSLLRTYQDVLTDLKKDAVVDLTMEPRSKWTKWLCGAVLKGLEEEEGKAPPLNLVECRESPVFPLKDLFDEGASSRVFKLEPKDANKLIDGMMSEVACKVVKFQRASGRPNSRTLLEEEAKVHRRISSHANIVRFLGLWLAPDGKRNASFIVMELALCNLEHYIEHVCEKHEEERFAPEGPLGLYAVTCLALHGTSALAFLHRHLIYHRDIKTANFLLCKESPDLVGLKLCDFGFAHQKEDDLESLMDAELRNEAALGSRHGE
ncbi:hypothetical protein CTAYLR_002400 [Chrysophaeum taylorii]|uniref:Protein kinase domain-containing protein n=1 Tax=Chrysophaeum taylorii TaxID=2483200 RepID=A0AAD7XN93_9STRA|nr:hypothetical protein CTAYLR_002400 [Chrysophaeum taylorii]